MLQVSELIEKKDKGHEIPQTSRNNGRRGKNALSWQPDLILMLIKQSVRPAKADSQIWPNVGMWKVDV